jgi:hypothetical protein
MGALAVYAKWTKDIEQRIEAILGNAPAGDIDQREGKPFKSRRAISVLEGPNLH